MDSHVFRDGYDKFTFGASVRAYVREADESIVGLIRERLMYLAYTHKSINCLFNPRDGRRLTLRDYDAVNECERWDNSGLFVLQQPLYEAAKQRSTVKFRPFELLPCLIIWFRRSESTFACARGLKEQSLYRTQ